MLTLNDVHTYYGDSHILQGISMEAAKGKITALLGRNGMGKTTAIHSIIGFTPPAKGRILFNGTDITGLPPYEIVRAGIALVPQGRRIFKSLTVKENMTLGIKDSSGRHGQRSAFDAEYIYRLFPVLREKAGNKGEQISGGEQQMLAFARALMTNPSCILMDEPYEGLSPAVVNELGKRIKELRDSGVTILLVDQNIQAALDIADYIYIMNKGKIIYEGTPAHIKKEQDIIRRNMLV